MDTKTPSLKQILNKLLDDMKKEKDLSKMIELNEKSLHQALLFGYPHTAFIEELKKKLE